MNELRRGIAAAASGDVAADGPDGAARRYRFPADFIGFAGHFPGDPILPAIVQVRTAISLAEERAGTALRLVEIRSAKFLAPVAPGQEVLFRCRRGAGTGEHLYDADVSVDGKPVAAFSFVLSAEGGRP
jgi:3-hydroxyacyl-[acyl-carrier-protein] dehydratase